MKRTVFITGASSGFGAACARLFAEEGAKVYSGAEPLSADDIAGIIFWVAGLPPHVNINTLEVMPVQQAWGPLAVHRG